ncbi:MAG TPA: hypothetical protein VF745_15030 [Steroidobacteraceae bacterium]
MSSRAEVTVWRRVGALQGEDAGLRGGDAARGDLEACAGAPRRRIVRVIM